MKTLPFSLTLHPGVRAKIVTLSRANWEELGWHTYFAADFLEIKHFTIDSRSVKKHSAFFAYDGVNHRAIDYVFSALKDSAAAVFIDRRYEAEVLAHPDYQSGMPLLFAADFLEAAGETISALCDDASRKIHLLGVTGTNGKTSIAWMFSQLMNSLKHKSAYVGTLGCVLQSYKKNTNLTTPDIVALHEFLRYSVQKKAAYAGIEASSHGLVQGRLKGLHWKVGIFTNLTNEHLDYHGSMENYFAAKKILFEDLLKLSKRKPGSVKGAIICTNGSWGKKLYQWLKTENPDFPVISIDENDGDVRLVSIQSKNTGYRCVLIFAGKSYTLKTTLMGVFNIYNVACVFMALTLFGVPAEKSIAAIAEVEPPPGRMEKITATGNRQIYIDYAHTPDALEQALKALQAINPVRILLVFGCGGDRDREKRPLMGKVAALNADFSIITNDNSRSEDPSTIFQEIKTGFSNANYVVVPDRSKAIRTALQIMKEHEVLLIAGKGHEDYQIIKDKKTYFSDRETAEKLIRDMEWAK